LEEAPEEALEGARRARCSRMFTWKMLDKMARCGDFDGISPGKLWFIDRKMVVYRIYSPFYLEKIWGLLIKNGTESNRFFR
jgi:hypothetical protein